MPQAWRMRWKPRGARAVRSVTRRIRLALRGGSPAKRCRDGHRVLQGLSEARMCGRLFRWRPYPARGGASNPLLGGQSNGALRRFHRHAPVGSCCLALPVSPLRSCRPGGGGRGGPARSFRFRSTSEPECCSTCWQSVSASRRRPDLAAVRPLPSPEIKRLGLVRLTGVLRNG
jgi:hypothetical protein